MGGGFGPRDYCRHKSADEQIQINQGNKSVIDMIYCPGNRPQCCLRPLPGSGESINTSDLKTCVPRGAVCPPRNPPPPPSPRPECSPSCDLFANYCITCHGPFPRAAGKKYYTGSCYPKGGDTITLDQECAIRN